MDLPSRITRLLSRRARSAAKAAKRTHRNSTIPRMPAERFYTGGGGAGTSLLQQPYLQDRDLEKLKAATKGISPSR
jgi:hypothetical protein